MNNKHRATLDQVFDRPTRSDIRWSAIEALVVALGGEVLEREGSRVALILNGTRAVFHRPPPKPTARKGAVDAVRQFLANAGVNP
ncbi:MAG TPA: type II toxin-antitoxin system HicA family toxin [Alphaproteobacteria bacterium]|nr:type II toxin-antitoxin system HicA family toxin [Alphaproteobacteria bacterium]